MILIPNCLFLINKEKDNLMIYLIWREKNTPKILPKYFIPLPFLLIVIQQKIKKATGDTEKFHK